MKYIRGYFLPLKGSGVFYVTSLKRKNDILVTAVCRDLNRLIAPCYISKHLFKALCTIDESGVMNISGCTSKYKGEHYEGVFQIRDIGGILVET